MINAVQAILPIVVVLTVLVIWQVHSQDIEFGMEFDLAGRGKPVDMTLLPPLCMDFEDSEHLRAIMSTALDKQVGDQAEKMFENWIRDPTDQPARAAAGMRRTLESYLQARKALREWQPKPCEEKVP